MGKGLDIFKWVRKILFSTANKQFLVFLFFLAISGGFWLVMTLNETYEIDVAIPVKIVNVPENVVVTSDETDTIQATLRDKGYMIASYLYGNGIKTLRANFKTYSKSIGVASVSATELQGMLSSQLASTTKVIGFKPTDVVFYYNYGQSKKVPVRWSGRVMPEHLYFISHVNYSPDSVRVYASKEKLDSIQYVQTEDLNYAGFRDTLSIKCNLKKIKGVRLTPDRIGVTFFTDVLTEESIDDVPVVCTNMPQGKVLRTFPSKVSVSFVAGATLIKKLRPEYFVVVVDYREIEQKPAEKCKLYLKKVPHGVSRAVLNQQQVDYLIESE